MWKKLVKSNETPMSNTPKTQFNVMTTQEKPGKNAIALPLATSVLHGKVNGTENVDCIDARMILMKVGEGCGVDRSPSEAGADLEMNNESGRPMYQTKNRGPLGSLVG